MSVNKGLAKYCQSISNGESVIATKSDRSIQLYISSVASVAAVSSVLSFFSLGFIYQLLMVGVIVLLFNRSVRLSPILGTLVTLFAINLIFILFAAMIFDENFSAIATVVGRYWGPIWFSCLLIGLCVSPGDLYFQIWFKLLIILTVIAFVQYFFSPTLWGIIPVDFSTLTSWSEGKSFAEYAVFYRSTSLLGSPQVWGLYSALSIFVLSYRLPGGINIPLQIFLWSGCLLSGNKISIVILLVFLTINLLRRPSIFLMYGAVVAVLLLSVNSEEIGNFRVLEHVLSISEIGEQEQDGRLFIWKFILNDVNLLLGGGVSYVERLYKLHNFVAESYILQSWVEMTLFFPLVLLLIFGRSFLLRSEYREHKIFVMLLFFGLTVSHAYSHPAFIVFWPLLLGIKSDYKP